jgi:hypothetical protein
VQLRPCRIQRASALQQLLPFGEGKKFANQGGVVNQIIGG